MYKTILFLVLVFLTINCSNSSSSTDSDDNSALLNKKLNVLLVANNQNDLAGIDTTWAKYMPKFNLDYKNVRYDTLKYNHLKDYDVVLLFENGSYAKSRSVGDTIYKYIMKGGNVLLGTFYGQGRRNYYGKLKTIDPVYHHRSAYGNDTLIVNSGHPLLSGLDTLVTYYGAGDDSLRTDAKLIARWKNNDIFAAYNKPKGRIVYLSVFPAEQFHKKINLRLNPFHRLWANAIRFTYAENISVDDFIIPSSSINSIMINHSFQLRSEKENTGTID